MGKRYHPIPEWFRIEHYDYAATMTAVDWLTELSNREAAYEWLLKKKREGNEDEDSKAGAIYRGIWSQVKELGLLNRPKYELRQKMKFRLQTSGKDHRKPLTSEQIEILTTLTTEPNYFEDGLKLPVAVTPLMMRDAQFIASYFGKNSSGLYIDGRTADEAWAEELKPDYGDRHLKVDITAPDELLAKEFMEWVKAERKKMDQRPQTLGQNDFDYWVKFHFLPFLDLDFYARIEDKPMKNMTVGTALFPDEFEIDLTGRVKDTLKKKAPTLLSRGLIQGLHMQLESEGKVRSSDDY